MHVRSKTFKCSYILFSKKQKIEETLGSALFPNLFLAVAINTCILYFRRIIIQIRKQTVGILWQKLRNFAVEWQCLVLFSFWRSFTLDCAMCVCNVKHFILFSVIGTWYITPCSNQTFRQTHRPSYDIKRYINVKIDKNGCSSIRF